MKNNIIQWIMLFLGFWVSTVHGEDLGVFGQTWEIQEEDIKERLIADAKYTNWTEVLRGLQNDSGLFQSNHLPAVEKNEIQVIDPSMTLDRDVVIRGSFIYHKGDKINPLDYVRPNRTLFFFDVANKKYETFANMVIEKYETKIMPILTNGNYHDFSQLKSFPIYLANQTILTRFQIKKVPALLCVKNKKLLLVYFKNLEGVKPCF